MATNLSVPELSQSRNRSTAGSNIQNKIGTQRKMKFPAASSITDSTQVPVQTSIICTIGPKTKSVPMLTNLLDSGMSVARLNFSHGDHAYHGEVINNIRLSLAESNRQCAIMLDTKGPEIRTGKLKGGLSSLALTKDSTFVWHHDLKRQDEGTASEFFCSYDDLATTVKPGSKILCADALLSFTVVSCDIPNKRVTCTVDNPGVIGNNKNMNLPNCKVTLPGLTEKDREDLLFGVREDIDIIAASFVRKASDVHEIRAVPGVRENGIAIISKIENQEGLDNFDEILAVSDGIMVARGDLGSEIPIEDVCNAQKMMIRKCNWAGKPVLDGSDAVMLSGETANGAWPIEAVQTMARICRSAESQIDHREYFMKLRAMMTPPQSLPESLASAAVKTAWDLSAPLIVVVTETGTTARLISKYRPHCPILTITHNNKTAKVCILSRGTIPYLVEMMHGTEQIAREAIELARNTGLCKSGDTIPVVFGRREGVSGSINSMKIHTCP